MKAIHGYQANGLSRSVCWKDFKYCRMVWRTVSCMFPSLVAPDTQQHNVPYLLICRAAGLERGRDISHGYPLV